MSQSPTTVPPTNPAAPIAPAAPPPPEVSRTTSPRVACDGTDNGALPLALGHPRVWLQIDPELGYKDCGYCDRRFVLVGGLADTSDGDNAVVSQRPGDVPV